MIQSVPVLTALRRLRESRFMSQDMLSERSGVAKSTISRIESGKQSATWSTAHKLADALDVKPQELVAEEA